MMKSYISICLVALLVFVGFSVQSQSIQLDRELPMVTQNGLSSINGFAGGLNAPQFNGVDLNRDGQQDLFVFDRVGNTALAFRRNSSGRWQLDQGQLEGFPELVNWVILRDYDGDGVQDIFTHNLDPFGIRVFKGRYNSSNRLEYTRVEFENPENILKATIPGGTDTQVYVSSIDYPDINDVDCDGDLDVVTFNLSGGFIEFYENRSVQLGYGLDSLLFVLDENCYGGIFESGLSEVLDLADSQGECATGFGPGELDNRHVGSTLLTLDEDGDGDKDLILGDLSFDNLNMSTNGGNCEEAWMTEQDPFFPSYDVSVSMDLFPAAFYVDVDADGIRDLVCAPNTATTPQDFDNVLVYRNTGADDNPVFELQQNDLIVGEMIEVGTGAKPALLDYNADGLMDLVLGNNSFYNVVGIKDSRLHLYENTGTSTNPTFTLVDDDFLNMTQFSIDLPPGTGGWDFSPTFGDLDGDGDMDALVGERQGRLYYFENTAGSGNPVSFGPAFFGYMDIDIGAHARPQMVDLNRDGLMDIAVGEKVGAIRYFQNVGSPGSPSFIGDETMLPNADTLGGVDARIFGRSTGYSVPFFVDFGDHTELFMGTEHGTLEHYGDITGNLDGVFELLNENILEHSEGEFLAPVFYDWDNDGFLEMVIGNERGGVSYFSTNVRADGVVNTAEVSAAANFTVFPNPVQDELTIEIGEEWGNRPLIQLFNTKGQMLRQEVGQTGRQQLSLSSVPAGVYWVRVLGVAGEQTQKLVVH